MLDRAGAYMKGKAWDLLLTRTGKIVTLVIGFSILGGFAVTWHYDFARPWSVVKNEIRLDKHDLVEIRENIADLEDEKEETGNLSNIKRKRLFQWYQQETDIVEGIKQKQKK